MSTVQTGPVTEFGLDGERFCYLMEPQDHSVLLYHCHAGEFRLAAEVTAQPGPQDDGMLFARLHAPEVQYERGDARDLLPVNAPGNLALGAALAYLDRALTPRRARGGLFAWEAETAAADPDGYLRSPALDAFVRHPAVERVLLDADMDLVFDPRDGAAVSHLDFNLVGALMAWYNANRADLLSPAVATLVRDDFHFGTATGQPPAPADLDPDAAAILQAFAARAQDPVFRRGFGGALYAARTASIATAVAPEAIPAAAPGGPR